MQGTTADGLAGEVGGANGEIGGKAAVERRADREQPSRLSAVGHRDPAENAAHAVPDEQRRSADNGAEIGLQRLCVGVKTLAVGDGRIGGRIAARRRHVHGEAIVRQRLTQRCHAPRSGTVAARHDPAMIVVKPCDQHHGQLQSARDRDR